ncbi:MAG: hypothetical protein ACXWC9_11330 [Pseudobdellovibrionaceae bacterium]
MKTLILSFAALLISFSVQASSECTQEEAQFNGEIVDIQPVDENSSACTYRIEFSELTSSIACPMNEEHAWLSRLDSATCSLKEGEAVSGYLIFKDGILSIEGRQ